MSAQAKLLLYFAVSVAIYARLSWKLEDSFDEDELMGGTRMPAELRALLHFYTLAVALMWPISMPILLAVRLVERG